MSINDQPMGTVLKEDGRWGLRYERFLNHPPEKVWAGFDRVGAAQTLDAL